MSDKLSDPQWMRSFHGWSTVAWFVASFPICVLLRNWLPGVVFMSAYAIVISHFASWQASRAEQAARSDIEDP